MDDDNAERETGWIIKILDGYVVTAAYVYIDLFHAAEQS